MVYTNQMDCRNHPHYFQPFGKVFVWHFIQDYSIYVLAMILLTLNIFHTLALRQATKKTGSHTIIQIKNEIHFQIVTDLIILTAILHYSGGIENPLVLFYFFHMIIASSIFSTLRSYLYAALYGSLPHYLRFSSITQSYRIFPWKVLWIMSCIRIPIMYSEPALFLAALLSSLSVCRT